MEDKDSRQFQERRVRKLARELSPGLVEFDDARTYLKFIIVDPKTGKRLTEASKEFLLSELADESDDWLRVYIKSLLDSQKGKAAGRSK